MKKTNGIFRIVIVILVAAIAQSCSGPRTGNLENQIVITTDSNLTRTGEGESVLYLLPSPGEILLRFYTSDIPYKPELLNPVSNRDKYIGSRIQSLILGIYITDMAYSALFERPAETVEYLESIQFLSSESGISSGIFESLLSRSKTNAGQLDSLVAISNEAFTGMMEFLETGGQETQVARISAGAYIEGLYIAIESAGTYSAESEMITLLPEMRFPLENLIGKLKSLDLTEDDKKMVLALEDVESLFMESESNRSETKVSEKSPGSISVDGGVTPVLTEELFLELQEKIRALRKTIVSF